MPEKKSFTEQIKQAMQRKHAAQHPDAPGAVNPGAVPGRSQVTTARPQKKVTGRGR